MDIQKTRARASKIWGFLTANFLYILIAVGLIGVSLIGIQKYFDRRAVEQQNVIIEQLDHAFEENRAENRKLIEIFNNTHSSTINILDSIKTLDSTINGLVENDLRFDREVTNLREEYKNARQPTTEKNPKTGKIIYRDARARVPLLQRELDVLRADRELYAAGANRARKRD